MVVATARTVSAQGTLSLLGTNAPAVVDNGDPNSVVLGAKVFSDVPGKVLGCSFYKAPANTSVHVVNLWDATGKLLATQAATGETASEKQSVLFASPVQIAAKQTFVCGYFAPHGHYSDDLYAFTAQKDAAPLHVPINGGVAVYSSPSHHLSDHSFPSKQLLGRCAVRSSLFGNLDQRNQCGRNSGRSEHHMDYRGAIHFAS